MKNCAFIIIFLFSISIFSQNKEIKEINNKFENLIIEDINGVIITDSIQKVAFLQKREDEVILNSKSKMPFSKLQPAVHLCSNGNFEEFESVAGSNVLKDFQYTIGNPNSPMQCKSINVTANQYINQYNPSNNNLMVTTVPSNYIDNYIGNINGFDQYLLKINHQNSSTTSSIVQAKRFKTNNENNVVFNFKAVLQSISGSGHLNEQPYFKGRILNKNGIVVDEFCLIGDPTNCIFTEAGNSQSGTIILYTQNWQTGNLNISSIPNNEEFTIEFMASRCGLNGHFGYAYVDDICLIHTDENLQGSINLDPLYLICPTLPISVCGTFTIPNSGGIAATVNSISINVYNELNTLVYSSSTPVTLDIINKTFCFELNNGSLPNTTTGNYNISASINYGTIQTTCAGTNFATATDSDANPGWDISFLNCSPDCSYNLAPATLTLCDTNSDGKEFFNLIDAESTIIGSQAGLTFIYYRTLTDATNNTNAIALPTNHESYTTTIFVRVIKDATCYKIIAIQLVVRNPSATISGILNVCSGSTILRASPGVSHLWSTGETTESIVITSNGTYSVIVTDSFGCSSSASVTIIPGQVAVLPTIIITQPDCFNPNGIIEVTSPASQYSYDGGITWTTNSIANNLPIGNYNVKIRTITGCESYSSTVTIRAFLSNSPYISTTQPTSCGAFGKITVNTFSSEYSFDDGLTWTTSNISNDLPIGTYSVRVKDSNGCISSPRVASIYGVFLSAPTYTTINPYCTNLGSITITNTNADEYSFDGGNTWQTSNTKNNLSTGTYILQIRNNLGCTSPNIYAYLNKFESSYPTYTIIPAGCDQYATLTINTVGDEFSFDGGLTWSTSNVLTNLNGVTTKLIKVRRNGNCVSLTTNVFINSYYLPLPVVTNFSSLICDNSNNNSESVNLSSFNAQLITNANNYSFAHYHTLQGAQNQISTELITNLNSYDLNQSNKIFYVRITDSNNCSNIALLDLTLILTPVIDLEDIYYLCENYTVLINEESAHETYLWTDGSTNSSIIISQAGNYSLTVTKTNGTVICSTTKNFRVVLSNPATISGLIPTDWTPTDNTITVNVTGLGDYEYSLNGTDYQDSNVFNNLENGEYTVYVRDKNGCGISSDGIYLLMHPKYFTPNGDGVNDFWKIKFSENEPNLIIKIFDRYGKLIKQLGPNAIGWDGTYFGEQAVSSDYWFVVVRENGKEHRGHFSLIR
ncbi:T9SS type B sorting domain-containing protein [Flavobacterium sp.]|jgi:gliding motility-associated-like protein|uniref:T9SS type B sorting domain-containing protein n=1 Tax=Flavobacterium sp. TaxID=239 RepID=UPI002A7F99D3|nr:T9SS type B sorting domain-containing protein [Flavobacterium sp.]